MGEVEQGQKKYEVLAAIPCLNEARHIEKLLLNLVAQSQELSMLIVVADGGSSDGTPEIVKGVAAVYENVIFLPNPKRTQSAGVNLAVEKYGDVAPYLIRLDAHADYPADYCRVLLEDAQGVGADCVVVAMDTQGEEPFQCAVAVAQNSKLGNGGAAHRNVDGHGMWVDHGHHALMRVAAYREVGGYDENFPQNQDAELDIRLAKVGCKIWLTGKTSMVYYPRSTVKKLYLQYFRFGRGRVRTIMKHGIMPKLRQMLPLAVAPAFLLLLLAPFYAVAFVPLVLWAVVCLGYGIVLGVKARDLVIVLAGPAAMIMHAGWSFGFWIEIFPAFRKYRL